MIHLLKVLVKKIAKQSNITVIPCLLIYFSLDRLLLYLIFLNFARDKQYVLGTISIINIMKPTNLLLFPIIILCSFTSVKEIPPYKNPALPVDERVKDLLGRMTIEEKFWQTYMMPGELDKGKDRFSHGIFGFQVSTIGTSNPELKQLLQYNPKLTAKEMAKKINEIQRYFVEETRLGIPIIAFDEALHGLIRGGATAFPQSIALAATFDTALVRQVSHAIAMEHVVSDKYYRPWLISQQMCVGDVRKRPMEKIHIFRHAWVSTL